LDVLVFFSHPPQFSLWVQEESRASGLGDFPPNKDIAFSLPNHADFFFGSFLFLFFYRFGFFPPLYSTVDHSFFFAACTRPIAVPSTFFVDEPHFVCDFAFFFSDSSARPFGLLGR